MPAAALPALLACVLIVLGQVATLLAQVTREEALASLFPGAAIRAEQLFLTASQLNAIKARAGEPAPSALVARYVATHGGDVVGRAYVDTHTVRTKKASLLISLSDQGEVLRIDVTAFLEPAEYRAPDAWLRQYRDRSLEDDVAVNRAIRPLAGATLTARATNAAVRRVMAIDEVLRAGGSR